MSQFQTVIVDEHIERPEPVRSLALAFSQFMSGVRRFESSGKIVTCVDDPAPGVLVRVLAYGVGDVRARSARIERVGDPL
jgi:hypothetical protein